MGRLRLFLALLIADWSLGTPGVGIETRTDSNTLMGWVCNTAGETLKDVSQPGAKR